MKVHNVITHRNYLLPMQKDYFSLPKELQELVQDFCYYSREHLPIVPEDVDAVLIRLRNIGYL